MILLPDLTAKSGLVFGWWYKESYYEVFFRSSEVTENMTLFGLYRTSKVTVFLDADGGLVVPSTKEVIYSGAYGELPTPTREGHSFAGWYTETPGGTLVNSSSAVRYISDHTIYAHWEIYQYTISFETKGGSKCENITQDYNTPVALPEPNRTGYTFRCWSLEESSGSKYTETRMPSKDIKLYAQWKPNIYSVKLDAKGGTVGKSSVNVTFGELYGTLPEPSNGVGNFLHWRIGGTDEEVGDTTIVETPRDHTLYAAWEKSTVTFNGMGGDVSFTSVTAKYGDNYPTPPTATLAGYTFVGWFLDETGDEEINSEVRVDIPYPHTLYAHWRINSHTVTFGFGNGTNATLELNYSDPIEYPADPEMRGYTFIGWDQSIQTVPDENATITAKWEANEYNVTLISGDSDSVISVTFGEEYGKLPTPSRTGYNFLGWFTEKLEGKKITNEMKVDTAKNHALYAHWEANKYIVTFDVNGGEELDDNEMLAAYNTPYGPLPMPKRAGHSFLGWFTDKLEGEKITDKVKVNKGNSHTLYAHWEANKYVVIFDVNEGERLVEREFPVIFGEAYGKLPTPSRTGYNFLGWFTEKLEGKKIANETKVDTAKNHALYAHWEANKYTVTLDVNGGEELDDNEMLAVYNTPYGPLPMPKRAGHSFLGWFTDKLGDEENVTDKSTVKFSHDHRLYAQWEVSKFVVSFDVNGGGELDDNEMLVAYNTHYGALPVPENAGHSFLGWFTEREGGEQITVKTKIGILKDHTLYAHWTLNNYTVAFDLGFDEHESIDPIVVTYGKPYSRLPEVTWAGHRFLGWFTEGGEGITKDSTVAISNDHTLYAHWETSVYTVTFDVNGGDELAKNETTVTYSTHYNSLPEATCTGHIFLGWFTEREGGEQVTSKTRINIFKDHTLYAHWSSNKYAVTFDLGFDEHESIESIVVTYGKPYSRLPEVTWAGHRFLGWFTEGGEGITKDSTVTILKDHVLQAQWAANNYTVTFDVNGGDAEEGVEPIDVTFGSAYGELPTLKDKTGHAFSGWTDDIFSGNTVNSTTVVGTPRNHTLYAVWTPIKYTITFVFEDGTTTSVLLDYNDRIIYPSENPSKSFHKFRRWCTNDIGNVEQCNVTHVPAKSVTFTASFDVDSSLVAGAAVGAVAGVSFIVIIVIIVILVWVSRSVKHNYESLDIELEANTAEVDEAVVRRIEGQVAAANILNDGDKKKKLREALKDADKSKSLGRALEDLNVNYEDTDDIDAIESFRATDASSIVAEAIRDDADLAAAAGYLALLYAAVTEHEECQEFGEVYFGMKDIDNFVDSMEDGSVSFGGIVSCFTKKRKAIQFLLPKDGGSGMPEGVLFKVRNAKGYRIGAVDKSTDEVLLEMGSEFKIGSVKEVTRGRYFVVTLSLALPNPGGADPADS